MGWLRSLLRDVRFRIWMATVLPAGLIFLAGVWMARRTFVAEVQALTSASPGLSTLEVVLTAMSSNHIYVAFLASVLWATISALFFLRRGVTQLRRVGSVAREMARGNYTIRYPLEPGLPDLTEEVARAINALAESLELTDQLRREMVANMAHEIRTPLTNLQGYLEALRDGVIEPNQKALDSVHEEVLRLVRLVDALHQLARADALRTQPLPMVPTDLDSLAEQIIRVIRPNAEQRQIRVLVDWGARGVLIAAHADSIAQVMRNILRNAVQYTNVGGTIRIQTSIVAMHYTFTCLNTGEGIAPDDLPFIFQRFYRTERAKQNSSGGVGLGLAISKELVEAHGGRIGAQSKGGWTSIWFEVPLTPLSRSESA